MPQMNVFPILPHCLVWCCLADKCGYRMHLLADADPQDFFADVDWRTRRSHSIMSVLFCLTTANRVGKTCLIFVVITKMLKPFGPYCHYFVSYWLLGIILLCLFSANANWKPIQYSLLLWMQILGQNPQTEANSNFRIRTSLVPAIKSMPAGRRRRCCVWGVHAAAGIISSACIKARTPWWLRLVIKYSSNYGNRNSRIEE